MKSILHTSTSATYLWKRTSGDGFLDCKNSSLNFGNGYFSSSSSSSPSSSWSLAAGNFSAGQRKLVIAGAKKYDKNDRKDSHSFVARPDEATGIFPEAVLLKEKKVQEDGKLMPEFADAEEEELFEYLNLQLESDLNVTEMRQYEVVYLIHEKHEEEVAKVNEKVEAFLREKKGKVWRFEDWGLRRLAYKIKKATSAHYILMNFELEAKWINDFKSMLDKEERVIRHLVMKRDEAITKVEPPPPDYYSLRSGVDEEMGDGVDMEYEDGEDYEDDDGEDWDDEEDMDEYEEDDGIIIVSGDEDEEEGTNSKSSAVGKSAKRNSREKAVVR